MTSRAPVALAIGVGYLLGRTHRARWALILGTAAATGRLNTLGSQALERGMSTMRSSPELAKLADNAGRLFDAGRTAAISAMNSRVESMGQTIQGGTKQVTDRAERGVRGAKQVAGGQDERARGRASRDEDVDEVQDEYRDEPGEYDQDEYDERDEYDQDEYNEDESGEDDESEEAEQRVSSGRRQSGGQSGRRPVVRRTGG